MSAIVTTPARAPRIGDIVLFYQRSDRFNLPPKITPLAAIVTGIEDGLPSLCVFEDEATAKDRAKTLQWHRVEFSETPKANHWSWRGE